VAIVIRPEDARGDSHGEGWVQTTLADARTFGSPAMVVRRLTIEPGAAGLEVGAHASAGAGTEAEPGTDEMLYVIRGDGFATLVEEQLPLAPETVLWLEPGDRYRLRAGPTGLDVLVAWAPGRSGASG
jgi:mannose-6-phosphate isomerase-like protein (cupin superfamily)